MSLGRYLRGSFDGGHKDGKLGAGAVLETKPRLQASWQLIETSGTAQEGASAVQAELEAAAHCTTRIIHLSLLLAP